MSKKIIYAADFHWGVPNRLDDIDWAARVVREYAKRSGIDKVVVLGDLFHDRKAIGIETICKAATFFEEAADLDQEWIAFPGNHDMFLRHSWDVNSLVPMKKHLTIVNDLSFMTIDNQRFVILPFITYEKSYMRVLELVERQTARDDILLTHIGVKGASLNTCFLLKDWSIVQFDTSRFRKVYTGHFHSRQQVGENVWYPGSPIPFKFDEGDIPHGFYVYDIAEGSHKFVNIWKAGQQFFPNEIAPPQFITILDEQLEQEGEAPIANNLVRVVLQHDYTDDEKRVMRDKLLGLGARSVRWMNLNQKEALAVRPAQHKFIQVPYRQLFRTWVEQDENGVKGLDMGVLHQVHDDVVHKGDEMYVVEESDV